MIKAKINIDRGKLLNINTSLIIPKIELIAIALMPVAFKEANITPRIKNSISRRKWVGNNKSRIKNINRIKKVFSNFSLLFIYIGIVALEKISFLKSRPYNTPLI